MAVRPKTQAARSSPGRAGPGGDAGPHLHPGAAGPVRVDARQITSAREWLPAGFYIAGYYWDIESGGLDLEERGHAGNYEPFVAKGIPRDGGLADLLTEARSPAPGSPPWCAKTSSAAAGTPTTPSNWNANSAQGILLFATDEPLDMDGTDPATILLRRTKQNIAEYFRLQLKRSMWRGHAHPRRPGLQPRQSPRRVPPRADPAPGPVQSRPGPHQNPARPGPGPRPDHRRDLHMRAWQKLGVPTIHARLTADPGTYPPADPETGWTLGGIYSMLANPKYTGYQVFGRRRKGKPVPPDKWYWSDQPTHPAIVDRDTWEAAQQVGAEHRSARDGATAQPGQLRTYTLRSRVRCKICNRRMCGRPKSTRTARPRPSTRTTCASTTRTTPATWPPPPATPAPSRSGKTSCMDEHSSGLSAYALAPGREQRLAELIPATAAAKKAAPRPAGRRPAQAAQADHRPAGQPDARAQRLLRHGR